jgi:hydrogenase expression/formation protein HypC
VSIVLTPDVKVGDYVLVHAGYSISVIDEIEAQETIKMIGDMLKDD